MKTYTAEEIKEILGNHRRWLYNQEGKNERADLSNANLCNADLSGANLSNANLCNADLSDANLSDANLSGADLRSANLRGANLQDADLRNADLSGLNGNLRHVKSIQTETYYITYTSKIIQIGGQQHTIEEWKNFNDITIKIMDNKALDWWKKWKPILMQIIELAPCEETK